MMSVLVHIAITPPHAPLPVFWRIGKRTIPYSGRACEQLRHLCETALRSNGLFCVNSCRRTRTGKISGIQDENPSWIPEAPREAAVAHFRLWTGHDCLRSHL
ncbi:hypothetical protein TNCV_4409651 [Trichonephila clavipes]|nr:hypothetical protein TNCV_4409651 [Trichonephila clavipes]